MYFNSLNIYFGKIENCSDRYAIAYNFSNIYFIKITYLPYRPACPISYADNDYRPPRA